MTVRGNWLRGQCDDAKADNHRTTSGETTGGHPRDKRAALCRPKIALSGTRDCLLPAVSLLSLCATGHVSVAPRVSQNLPGWPVCNVPALHLKPADCVSNSVEVEADCLP
jgi:hypothetical protein